MLKHAFVNTVTVTSVMMDLFAIAQAMNSSFRATLPFFLPLLAGLAVISFVPWVTEWLPALVFGR